MATQSEIYLTFEINQSVQNQLIINKVMLGTDITKDMLGSLIKIKRVGTK